MISLRPVRKGLSYYDANRHKLIEVTGEAYEVKRRIEERWPQLAMFFDKDDLEWVVVQKVEYGPDVGTEKLVGKYRRIDNLEEILDRADPTSDRYADPIDVMDKAKAEHDKEEDRKFSDISGDAGERLIHAFKKDGLYDHLNIYGPKPKKIRRAIRAGQ
jgi:hypothetical protein